MTDADYDVRISHRTTELPGDPRDGLEEVVEVPALDAGEELLPFSPGISECGAIRLGYVAEITNSPSRATITHAPPSHVLETSQLCCSGADVCPAILPLLFFTMNTHGGWMPLPRICLLIKGLTARQQIRAAAA
jgi:hypothetical protein